MEDARRLIINGIAGAFVLMPEEEARLRVAMGDKLDSLRQIGLDEHTREYRRTIERSGEYEHPEVDHPVEYPAL